MVKLQQLVIQVVIGTMALGGVACLCPTVADAHATPVATDAHQHHGHASDEASAGQADCGHEDCDTACELGSAVSLKASVSGKPAYQPDHASILPLDLPAFALAVGAFISAGSPRPGTPLRQETPVQRYDRLLD